VLNQKIVNLGLEVADDIAVLGENELMRASPSFMAIRTSILSAISIHWPNVLVILRLTEGALQLLD
jgi:hypothetical protein